MTNWEYVKEFYKQCFGIDGWVVELYANLDILQLCVSGASNKSICKFTDLDLEDIVEILITTFHFSGWQEDLPVNPYKLYIELVGLPEFEMKVKFISEMTRALNGYKIPEQPDIIYNCLVICKTMKEIEERIQDEWI